MRFQKGLVLIAAGIGMFSLIVSTAYGDLNMAWGPPLDATAPNQPEPKKLDKPQQDPTCQGGSVIECQNQTLGESLPIIGTPFMLNYRSNRASGNKAANVLQIPLSGASVPASLQSIRLIVSVAGRQTTQTFPPSPNQTATFSWDGKDIYGRTMQGQQQVDIQIGYVYSASYLTPPQQQQAFALFGSNPPIGVSRAPITMWQRWQGAVTVVGTWNASGEGLGGWSLNVHHAYDPSGQVLYMGDGRQRIASQIYSTITTVAGSGALYDGNGIGDGGPATQAIIDPEAIAMAPDGSMYIADGGSTVIRRVDLDGIITTVAGIFGSGNGHSGDGGPATQANIGTPIGVAFGPDGSFYIASPFDNRVRRVGPDGTITTVAGNGATTNPPFGDYGGDGGPATQAQLNFPWSVAVGPDNSLYIADRLNGRIRRVGLDGIITTVAGNGTQNRGGDGGPATQTGLSVPSGIAVGSDGSLYIADSGHNSIRKVGPDGIITTVAGNTLPIFGAFSGDGGPATQAQLNFPWGVAVGPDDSLYISDIANNRIRRVAPNGIITTIVGSGEQGFSGDGGSATQAALYDSHGVAIGPDGAIYIPDVGNRRIRRVGPPFPGFSENNLQVPSEDGREIYEFDGSGRHLRTLDALTGAVRYQFGYDSAGRLISVTDGNNNITTIQRDSSGAPTGIIGPFGQRTALTVDTNGFLASVINPANEAILLGSSIDGLLTSLTDPKGGIHSFTYDSSSGRLVQDADPAGGSSILARVDGANSYTVSLTTALNRTNTYLVQNLSTGDTQRVNTDPSGNQTTELIKTDGTQTTTSPDGMITTLIKGPDPRFGMQAPLAKSLNIITPGGIAFTATTNRTATLTDPTNPLSLLTQTDTVNISGRTYTSLFNATQKLLTTTTPVGRQSTTQLDTLGRVTGEQISGIDPLTYGYDSRGRLTTISQGIRTSSLTYNSQGFISSITDPLSRSIGFLYDSAGRVLQQTLPDGRVIGYTYDGNGNVTSITPPGRPNHAFAYTPVDLEQSYTPPDVGIGSTATQYTYNLDKQLTQITRPDGQTITLGYDPGGRLSTWTIPGGTLQYSYSPATGNLSTITAPDGGALSYTYDGALLKSTSWSGTVAGSVGHTYDNNIRITSQMVNGGNLISFGYDNDGLLNAAGSLSISRSVQNGLISGTTLSNVTDTRAYNTFGEVNHYTASVSGTALLDDQYTRDNLGRITQKVETVSGVTTTYVYSYDTAGRLTDVTQNGAPASHYGYDSNSNRTSLTTSSGTISASYDAQDRLLNYGTNTYTYTANGELLSKTDTALSQTTQYTYDVLGNLTSVLLPNGNQINYVIDGQNRRIGRKVNGTLVQGFLYQNQLNPVAELDGNGAVISRFVYGTKANVPDYMIKGGVMYRIISDHLGSPRLIIDITTGSVLQRVDYDEFGRIIQDTNPGFQPFGFAGGIYDRDTKMTRFGVRDYDAESGRWTAKDPIRFAAGDANLYGYVSTNPINLTDPLGMWTASIGTVISGSLFGFGGGGGTFINIGHDPNADLFSGWSVSLSGTAEAGATAGLGFSPGINFSFTNACNVSQLNGTFIGGGRGGLGRAGIGYFQSPDGTVQGGGFTLAFPGASTGYTTASAGVSTTSSIIQWSQGQGISYLVSQ